MEQDYIEMMRRCLGEIEQLRARITQLEPKAHAYESITIILDLLPKKQQGYGEDIAWKLRREIEKIEKAENAKKQPGNFSEPDLK